MGELRYDIILTEEYSLPDRKSTITISSKFNNKSDYVVVEEKIEEILKNEEDSNDLLECFMWLWREVVYNSNTWGPAAVKRDLGWSWENTEISITRLLKLGLFEKIENWDVSGLRIEENEQDNYSNEIYSICERVEIELYHSDFSDRVEALTNGFAFALQEISSLKEKAKDYENEKILLERRLKLIDEVCSKMLKLQTGSANRILEFNSWNKKYINSLDS